MNSRKEIFSIVYRLVQTFVGGTSAVLLAGGTLLLASTSQTDDTQTQAQIGHNSTTFVVEIKEHAAKSDLTGIGHSGRR